ncbi:MAG: imidazolonepropionase [Calditrichaeota bacterium]|nr:imidazolonepropionase [Calditrichota bacterium]
MKSNNTGEVAPNCSLLIRKNVWLELKNGKIHSISSENEQLPTRFENKMIFDACGGLVTPGLIDAHTHPVFVGTRQAEFVRRCRGETYQQIAAAGGGILNSIHGVREASEEQLTNMVKNRLDSFLESGITSVEGKSGYGLTLESELKSLRVLKHIAENHPIDISPTLLGTHVVPPEFKSNPDRYVDLVCNEMIPIAVEENIIEGVDVFLEDGAYNLKQARRVFESGSKSGLMLRIHADQFTAGGGAELAAEFNATTADHMDRTPPEGYRLLAEAGVTVVLLPGAVFFLGLDEYAPGRSIVDSGCRIALSTDFNPGSSPTQSLTLMMTLGCVKMGLSPEEALQAVTSEAARAIGRADKLGHIATGYQADLCLWKAEDIAYIPYNFGNMKPEKVFKNGRCVANRGCRVNAEEE